MTRPDTESESEAPAAGPGAVSRFALRGIDACLRVLQRLRSRFAPNEEEDENDRGGKRGGAHPAHEAEADVPAAPKPSFLHRALLVLIGLLIGGAVGAVVAYRGLSLKLEAHSAVVERMQDEIDAAKKDEVRTIKLMDKFLRENAEYRQQAREAQHEADTARKEAAQLEAQVAEMKRAEQATQQTPNKPATAPQSRLPPKTGNCAVGDAGDLSKCIEKFNR